MVLLEKVGVLEWIIQWWIIQYVTHPKERKFFDLLQMDTHVNVALHKDIFVSSPSKNNKIYLDMEYEWHFYILTYIAHYKNLEFSYT